MARIQVHAPAARRGGYKMFRRVALHPSAIQDLNQLYAEPVNFGRTWIIPAGSVTTEDFQALEKDFSVLYNKHDNTYTLRKQVPGPILITNYDPSSLSTEGRARLSAGAETWLENDVSFNIRPDYPGGEWPIKGAFRLRSLHSILYFLGQFLNEDPEYEVGKDARTPPIADGENLNATIGLIVSDASPLEADLSILTSNRYYSVNAAGPLADWNQDGLRMLYLLF